MNSVARVKSGWAGDAAPRPDWFRSPRSRGGRAGRVAASDGGKASEGREASRGGRTSHARRQRCSEAVFRKRDEPQGRQRVAIHAHGIGGANRRGGGKPRGRNAEATWQSSPEGSSREGGAGSGLWCWQDDGGAFFGNPRRGSPVGRPMGPMETVGAGKDGIEGHEGGADECFTHLRATRSKVLEGEPIRASVPVNAGRAVESRCPTTSPGEVPPSRWSRSSERHRRGWREGRRRLRKKEAIPTLKTR